MKTNNSIFSHIVLLLACILLMVSCREHNPAIQYTVTTTVNIGGSISPGNITLEEGKTAVFTVSADSDYEIETVSGCDGGLAMGVYTTGIISDDCVVSASFTSVVTSVAVQGRVLDETGKSIEGVEAFNDNGVLATTDDFGMLEFTLDSSDMMSVRLRKPNHTNQTIVLDVLNNKADFTGTMTTRNLPVIVSADTTFNISGQYGARVQVNGSTLVDRQGNTVTGEIELNITPVDVSDNDQLKVFPGAYAGVTLQGVATPIIMPYGTVEYYLSQNGEELNLAPNNTAVIEIPIFVTEHPDGSEILEGQQQELVWFLDEVTGQWMEEAMGTVVASADSPTGLALQATISHFSWWNYDYSVEGGGGGGNNQSLEERRCRLPVVMNGIPAVNREVIVLLSFITANTSRPRYGGSLYVDAPTSQTIPIPRNMNIAVDAYTISSPEIYYSASTIFNCDSQNITLDFSGPNDPLIQDFDELMKPVFALSSNNIYEIVNNLATFSWAVIGQDSLNLIETEIPLNIPLQVAQGSVDVLLEAPSVLGDTFSFTLIAQNSVGQAEIERTLEYIPESAPLVDYFSFVYLPGPRVQITWDVEGADTVNIAYVPNGSSVQNLTYIGGQSNISGNVSDVQFNLIPNGGFGYQIVVEFSNQYGNTYQTFSRGDCPPDTDLC